MAACVVQVIGHRGAEWWKDTATRDEERRHEAEQVIADNARRGQEREDRENRESRERADAGRQVGIVRLNGNPIWNRNCDSSFCPTALKFVIRIMSVSDDRRRSPK
jgi:hypothetical protein